jgi:uncharacterized RDD family membrane protein YckC
MNSLAKSSGEVRDLPSMTASVCRHLFSFDFKNTTSLIIGRVESKQNITMPKANLETTQNVYLHLDIASVGDRILAAFIDRALLFVYIFFCSWVMDYFDISSDSNAGEYYLSLFFFGIPVFFYALALDVFSNGQSFGKKWAKLRVIKTDGSTPSIGDFILRWMLRLLDLYFVVILIMLSEIGSLQDVNGLLIVLTTPLVGILFMVKSKQGQRLGDLASNTIVVKTGKKVTLADTVLPMLKKQYTPRFLNVLDLNDRDVRIIKEVIDNSQPGEQKGIVEKLATKAKEVLSIETKMPPRKFLYTLMKDYNYLAMEESKKTSLY